MGDTRQTCETGLTDFKYQPILNRPDPEKLSPHKLCDCKRTTIEVSPFFSHPYCDTYKVFSYKSSRFIIQVSDPVSSRQKPQGMVTNQFRSARFNCEGFYQSALKSKLDASVKGVELRINLNVENCGLVAAPVHALSRARLLLPLLLSHNIPPPSVCQCVMDRLVH